MSDNPFEQPVVAQPSHSPPVGAAPFPTMVMVICILCLILGLFGLLSACAGGFMLMGIEAMASVMPPEARESFQEGMNIQFFPIVIQSVLGVISAPLMVVACIGCLIRKPWGRSLFVIAALGFIVWNFAAIASATWMTLFHIEKLAAPNIPTMGEAGATQMAYFGQVFAIVLSAAFLCFYIFAAFYMKKQSVKDFFASQAV